MPKQIAKIGFFEFPKFLPGTGFSAIESAIESAMESAIQCKFYRLTRPSGQYGPIIGRNGPKSNVCKNRFLELRIFWGFWDLGDLAGTCRGKSGSIGGVNPKKARANSGF